MKPKINMFTKVMFLILAMLIPILVLYSFSNYISKDVIRTELNKANYSQLSFFMNQVETKVDLMSMMATTLIQDPDVASFREIYMKSKILKQDEISVIKQIQNKFSLQRTSTNWNSHLYLFSPSIKKVISTDTTATYDQDELVDKVKTGWQMKQMNTYGYDHFVFEWYTVQPFSAYNDIEKSTLIMGIQFSDQNLIDMLDEFKQDGRSDPFFYKAGVGQIANRTLDNEVTGELLKKLNDSDIGIGQQDYIQLNILGKDYMVNMVKSSRLGMYLIDYIPMDEIMKPIAKANSLFYLSIGVLLMMGCFVSYMLYIQIQVPIRAFMISFQALKKGDYSVRIARKGNNEFGFLFDRFNLMAARLQELIENIYMEKIHTREAKVKQLQSQINPHFFYNCFSYISSMAKLGQYDSIVAMSENLSKYYRYTTRQERDFVPLNDEVRFVVSYLEIQKMRMPKLNYEINIPIEANTIPIPLLLLQPIVENAVVHGIEKKQSADMIVITGQYTDTGFQFTIDDNGGGMEQAEMEQLQWKLQQPMDEDMGCGMWNVHQRTVLQFGSDAGIQLSHSPLGGLRVVLHLKWNEEVGDKDEDEDKNIERHGEGDQAE